MSALISQTATARAFLAITFAIGSGLNDSSRRASRPCANCSEKEGCNLSGDILPHLESLIPGDLFARTRNRLLDA